MSKIKQIVIGLDTALRGNAVAAILIHQDGDISFDHCCVHAEKRSDGRAGVLKNALFIRQTFEDEMQSYIDTTKVTHMGIEGMAFSRAPSNTSRDIAGIWMMMASIFYREHIELSVVSPKSLKKWLTHDGNADKEKVFTCMPKPIKKFVEQIAMKNPIFVDSEKEKIIAMKTKYKRAKEDLTDAFAAALYAGQDLPEIKLLLQG